MTRRRVTLLGATGSIGDSAIKVAESLPECLQIVGMAASRNAGKLAAAANRLRPAAICLDDPAGVSELREKLDYKPDILLGAGGLVELATRTESEMVLVAIIGTAGLRPTLAAIGAGKDLAIASKEILVMAGQIVMKEARARGVKVLPVDSEHNAIYQCLEGRAASQIKNLVLTASGGPFRTLPPDRLAQITVAEALRHPTWKMGPKITIDSATLFNKGLEMIEAHWLFDVSIAQVKVVVHPQSIVHSLVEFTDGSMLAQLSHSDMCFPIQYAVTWPHRVANTLQPLKLSEVGRLDFEEPRTKDFPALDLARRAGEEGGIMPAVLNASNEIAVEAFLEGRIRFPQIWATVDRCMSKAENFASPSLDDIIRADAKARMDALEALTAV